MGSMVHRNQSGHGFIKFEHDGREHIAQFLINSLFINGTTIGPEVYSNWPGGKIETVFFSACRVKNLAQNVKMENQDDNGMETEIRFQPEWRCTAVWIGEEPSPEQLGHVANRGQTVKISSEKKNKNADFKDLVKDCEYICGRLTKFIDRGKGILVAKKDRPILFKIQDLVVDGKQMTTEDSLSTVLQLGDILSCFYQPTIPAKTIGEIVCHHVAVQIWKGKRTVTGPTTADPDASQKSQLTGSTFPPPNDATHFDQNGIVIEIDGLLGKLQLQSADEQLNSQRVLFARNRMYLRGQRLRFKDALHDVVKIGDTFNFNMVLADQTEAKGEYEWLAVLAWIGEKPSTEDASFEVLKRPDSYRAKVLCFETPTEGQGVMSGLLHINAGPNNLGERVYFHRENVYVFGAKMVNADLVYILSENEKVQLEVELLDNYTAENLKLRFGCDVKLRATMVWIGPCPKPEQNCVAFPTHVGNIIYPFLAKRGMDEEFFTRLIMGDVPPKTLSSTMVKGKPEIPPSTILGRVIELKKADSPHTGCEHGLFVIENGPHANEKAFFNRNILHCFGHHMIKADLMQVIKETDRFFVEVQGDTNNKSVPFRVVCAWIGPHPSDVNRKSSADINNPVFKLWLETHGIKDVQEFLDCTNGLTTPRPYFPLALEAQNARIIHIFPHNKTKMGNGCEYGILKIYQGSLAKKDVLFERSSIYLWNVNFANGDISYILKESDRVFCEVTEIVGKDRKKWQGRLNTQSIPKYCATLVYIGGGRPKGHLPDLASTAALQNNSNLQQWLAKRGVSLDFFKKVVDGLLPPKQTAPTTVTIAPKTALAKQGLAERSSFGEWDQQERNTTTWQEEHQFALPTPSRQPWLEHQPMYPVGGRDQRQARMNVSWDEERQPMPAVSSEDATFGNPIVSQARAILSRVMACASPDDPKVKLVISGESDIQLALFVAKTLEKAVEAFGGAGGGRTLTHPGPIAPPKKTFVGDNSDFDVLMGRRNDPFGNSGGLYGLEKPLIDYPSNHQVLQTSWTPALSTSSNWLRKPARRESPNDFNVSEPPLKRKLNLPSPFDDYYQQ